MIKLLVGFLGGFAAGVAICWIYMASMKATLKLYKTYIQERIDAQSPDEQHSAKPIAEPPVDQKSR
jgi:hypothetical protein